VEPELPEESTQPSQVVDLAAKRQQKAAAADSEGTPPPPEESASDGKPGKGGGKREKKIDWGRFNYLIDNFVLIYPSDTAWDSAKRKRVRISDMAHMYGSDYVRMWKASGDRKSIDEEQLVFDPTMSCGPECINLYDGLAIEPVPCADKDVEVMLELLRHLCGRCDSAVSSVDEVMHWVLCWLALPLQNRGAKMATCLVFHGPQGTGKNLFFDAISAIYGRYGVMVGQTEIEEKYNGWLSAKQFIIGNEVVSRQELYHNKNRLKWVIDAKRIPIRTMQTDTHWEDNWANLVFLSNENKPLVIEIGDRRHLVVYTPAPEEKTLYERARAFIANGGAGKFLHYLLNYPVDDFHEHTKPLMTDAKQELIELGMSADERFMTEWSAGYLHLPMRVCSVEQLYRAFQRWCLTNGERFVPAQATFTTAAKRWALERIDRDELNRPMEPRLSYKVVSLANQDTVSGRKSVRCWIPRGCAPLNGVTEGEWAAGSIDAFELDLGRFLRSREGSDGEPPAPQAGKKGGGE
jgi:putative DNA primase/helicase